MGKKGKATAAEPTHLPGCVSLRRKVINKVDELKQHVDREYRALSKRHAELEAEIAALKKYAYTDDPDAYEGVRHLESYRQMLVATGRSNASAAAGAKAASAAAPKGKKKRQQKQRRSMARKGSGDSDEPSFEAIRPPAQATSVTNEWSVYIVAWLILLVFLLVVGWALFGVRLMLLLVWVVVVMLLGAVLPWKCITMIFLALAWRGFGLRSYLDWT